MTSEAQRNGEGIVEEAMSTLEMGGRGRIFFPGGPLDPISIEFVKGGTFVAIEIETGVWANILVSSVVGWCDLDDFDEATQTYSRR
ncbi:MAG: hypothetical protein CL955_03160 [Erythrobacteraceae bacterium]|mgnify:CR=1 FL=1|nr:hypothetical protein [Erythrobacteraceae bacterium]|tara:strand:- start:713 stop:970 length:258 start_codon:yes stop_codon:yes gene_type:complete